jgi:hypothetical protein
VVSGTGGSFGDASSPSSPFSGTAGTTYTLRWTISNSPCTASTDDVVITVSGAVNYGTVSTVNTNDHLVISQVYGGGGITFATYTNDFVEIFNPTSSAVSVTNWKIQYASSAGSYADAATLSGTINPGKYYLISLGGGATGAALPTADATGSTNLSGSIGKVRLINASSTVIDKLGYGNSSSPDPEGTAETSASGNVVSYQRVNNGCTDTDNNANDFTNNTTANARNSSSPANDCSGIVETDCSGDVPTAMSVSGASGSTFTYQWYSIAGQQSAPTGNSTSGWTSLGSTDGANTATYTPTTGISSSTTYACFVTPTGTPSCGTGTWAGSCRQVLINSVTGGTVAGSTSVCSGGNPAAFTESVASTGTGLTYQWESSASSDFSTTITTIAGATSTTYDVPLGISTTYYRRKVTSLLNDKSCFAYSNTLTVTVNALPTVSGTTSVCVNGTTQLTGSGTPAASNPWSSNSANATVNSTGLVTGVTAGTAIITYTDSNGCVSAGTTITVNALPTPTFTTSPAATLCSATSATYTTQSGQSNYIWNVPGTLNTDYTIASGSIGTSSNTVTINWLTSGSKTVTVNYNNASGCTAASPASNTTTVIVSPTTSNAGSAQSICSGSTATLAANTPSVGTGAWSVTSGPSTSSAQFSSTSITGAVFTPAGGAGSYVLTWTISNGSCTSSSTVTITVNAIPVTTGVSICQGGSGSLAATDVCRAFVNSGTTISGSFATTPTANRLNSMSNSATCAFSPTITRNYTAIQFQVSVTGNYGFLMDNNGAYDGAGYITSGNFVPGTCPGSGVFIKGDDDGGATSIDNEPYMTASLTAGVTYTLYSLTYSSSIGTTTGSFSWTVTPPSGGQIMLNNNAVVNWYTAASGGSVIGTGTSFNPVGVSGSGLSNTNTAGTYTFYAACSNTPTCRAAVNFSITAPPNAGSNGTLTVCQGTTPTNAALFAQLGGTPDTGGTWSNVGLVYTYTVAANSPCTGSATATVTVTEQTPPNAGSISGRQSICVGGTTTFTSNGSAGSWSSSDTSIATVNSSGQISGVAAGTATITYTVTGTSPCSNATATRTITVTNTYTWTGTVSKEWSNPANWSCGNVPNANSDIVIHTSPNAPELDVNYTLPSGKTLTITGTGSLTIAPTASLTIAGTADFGGKSVVMKSDSQGTAILGQVTGTLLNANNVTVERYIPEGKRAFRFLTPGVTTTNFIRANWQNNGDNTISGKGTHITGSSTGSNGFDATSSGSPSMFYYNNQVGGTGNGGNVTGWTAIPNTNATNLHAGMGYRILIRGDRTPSLLTTASQPNMNAATTLSATGTLTTGTVTYNANNPNPITTPAINTTDNTITAGYSLIGNPYVSPIDWHAVQLNNIEGTYYAWDPNMGSNTQRGRYVAYTITDVNTGVTSVPTSQVNRFIQPGQAFFVKTIDRNQNPSITFEESDKASTFRNVFREETPVYTKLNISLFEPAELGIGGYALDGVVALYGDSFSNTVGIGDVPKMEAGGENLAIFGNNLKWAMQGSSPIQNNDELLLKTLRLVANKNYTFKINAVNLDASVTAYLVDNFLATTTSINLTQDYFGNFSTTSVVASYSEDRFKIVFQVGTLTTPDFESSISLYPNPSTTNAFYLNIPNWSDDIKVKLHNAVGQEIPLNVSTTDGVVRYCKSKIDLAAGMYIITITKEGSTVNKKWLIQR